MRGEHMPVLSLFPKLAFDPEEVALIAEAYERACAQLQLEASDLRRELLARKILEIAARGLREPKQMCARAVFELGRQHSAA